MEIQQNVSLKTLNTFGISASAKSFSACSNLQELQELTGYARNKNLPFMVLGGGSNVLFTTDYNGLIIKNNLKGISLLREDENHYYVKAFAGENWHAFVQYCVDNNYAGVENLSLIPGNIGASPMQNIGAYGVELKDTFYELEAWNYADEKLVIFNKDDCEFGYRESIFKGRANGMYAIVSVTFKLDKKPVLHTSYGAIQHELEKMQLTDVTIKDVSRAVINIRQSKLPDPAVIGNAGSFFKNPTIPLHQFTQLKEKFTGIVGYPAGEQLVKVAAGWLIEQCGWKGYRKGDAGCHDKQALVLVNFGNASGSDVYQLSSDILESVKNKFDILLEREVNIV